MPHLFSPLKIARVSLANRIVLGVGVSGCPTPGGFVRAPLVDFYARRAAGGAGLICVEAALVLPGELPDAQLGVYHDAFVPGLTELAQAIHARGARACLALTGPQQQPEATRDLLLLREAFIRGAWRAHAAGFDAVLLSAAEPGVLRALLSPLHNQRADGYGGGIDGRLRLAQEIVEGVRAWLGRRMLIGFRLNVDELAPGGIELQDAGVIARRIVGAGAGLLDVTVAERDGAPVARFPGWRVPLAASLKRLIPDVPIITGGGLDDPQLADSAIRDGSVDLVRIGRTLRADPDWPQRAFAALRPDEPTEPPLYSFVLDDDDRYV